MKTTSQETCRLLWGAVYTYDLHLLRTTSAHMNEMLINLTLKNRHILASAETQPCRHSRPGGLCKLASSTNPRPPTLPPPPQQLTSTYPHAMKPHQKKHHGKLRPCVLRRKELYTSPHSQHYPNIHTSPLPPSHPASKSRFQISTPTRQNEHTDIETAWRRGHAGQIAADGAVAMTRVPGRGWRLCIRAHRGDTGSARSPMGWDTGPEADVMPPCSSSSDSVTPSVSR